MRIGLDVGGTKTDAVAVTDDRDVVGQVRMTTGWGVDEVVGTIREAVAAVLREPGVNGGPLTSIGIGIPGLVEGGGRVLHAVNLGIEDVDLAGALEPAFGVPVRVENDVKAAALGAHALRVNAGHGRPDASMAYLNLGTGVAAGIVRDGTVLRGARGTAGEVGHISIDPAGPECRCGQRGCIEALAGGGSIAARWAHPGPHPVGDVFDAADGDDATALELRAGLAHGVASAVRILILSTDVDVVVLGGGLTLLGDRLMDDVRAQLRASAGASPFLRSLHLDERVERLPEGSPAAALGAALVGAGTDDREVLIHG